MLDLDESRGSHESRCNVKKLIFVSLLVLSACGIDVRKENSHVLFTPNSAECKDLLDVYNDSSKPNVGFATLTLTHPEFLARFVLTSMLSKPQQIRTGLEDQKVLVRRIIRSFLSPQVIGAHQQQPLRPFVIPEFLCPLLSLPQQTASGFCGSAFHQNQPAAIAAAQRFLDQNIDLGNFTAIDTLFQPIALIVRPERFDLPLDQQAVEFRVVYGLRDISGRNRKPASLILEFKGTEILNFYENVVRLFRANKDKNDKASRESWAFSFENQLDCASVGNCNPEQGWELKQIRMNELAFRGNDVLWDFKEFNFPSAHSSAAEFRQVPVAFTPFLDFAPQDKLAASMNADFNAFLQDKGKDPNGLNTDQSIDLFEEFMSGKQVSISNSFSLKSYASTRMSAVKNAAGGNASKAFAFHNDPAMAAPSALARPAMKWFDGDNNWSKSLKETCQGCHVSTSSIAAAEDVQATQGFYQISPRIVPMGPEWGPALAGSNVLSPFVLKETKHRYRSFLSIVGCLARPLGGDPREVDGHSRDR